MPGASIRAAWFMDNFQGVIGYARETGMLPRSFGLYGPSNAIRIRWPDNKENYYWFAPPLTSRCCPEMKDERSLAKNSAAFATSSTSANRPIGQLSMRLFLIAG
jgi:hypothetical protein